MRTSSKRLARRSLGIGGKEEFTLHLLAIPAFFLSAALLAAPLVPIVSEADPLHDESVLAGAVVSSFENLVSLDGRFNPGNNMVQRVKVLVTGYSSTYDQTDSTPFITASNTPVREGVVAANDFTFGTRVRFPELFGDKIFVVEDRLHPKNSHKIDIWFPTRESAQEFGIRETVMEILPEEI